MTIIGLLWGSWWDIRVRAVPRWGLILWGIAVLIKATVTGWSVEVLLGILPGVLLLVLSGLTGNMGKADGLILLYLGLDLGLRKVILLFGGSLLLLFGYAMVLFVCRKSTMSLIPYVPLLLVPYLLIRGVEFAPWIR